MTPERAEAVYTKLVTLIVELDPDPVARGPLYLQDLIAKVRGYLNAVSIYTQEAHRERHEMESRLDALETAFQVAADELLTGDGRVTRLPNIDDRKSMVNLILSTERQAIQGLKGQIRSLGHVEKAIRNRQKELDNTMSAIRLQRSLIQAELRTGSFYGDEGEKSRGDAWGRTTGGETDDDNLPDDDELTKLVAEAEAQIAAGEVVGDIDEEDEETPSEPSEETTSEETPSEGTAEALKEAFDGFEDRGLLPHQQEPAAAPEPEPAEPVDPQIERFLDAGEDDDDFADLFDAVSDDSGV
jgi:hypothetical protein